MDKPWRNMYGERVEFASAKERPMAETPKTLEPRLGLLMQAIRKYGVDSHASTVLFNSIVADNAAEREQVRQFIRDMYTGRFAKRAEDYWALPQWIREAIESDPIYHEEMSDDRHNRQSQS